MACCRPSPDADGGYALPAAMVMSLALAVIAASLMARSMTTLRQARDDFDRLKLERGLDGAHLLAASAVLSSQTAGPYRWSIATEVGPVDIVADEERLKLSYAQAASLPNDTFERLGVQDIPALRTRLTDAGQETAPPVTADLDDASLWKFCAPAIISPLGQDTTLHYTTPGEPGPGPLPPSWRVGEAWRVSIATRNGWRDNRLVRFTGDALRPVATVRRQFFRTTTMGEQQTCDELLSSLASG